MAKATQASREELEKLREENARLKKSIEDLWTINQLARVISSTMPVNRILDRVISVSVRAIGASQGTISLLEEQDTRDRFKTLVRKVDESHFTTKYRLDQDLSGWMIKHRKSLLINDLKNDTTFKGAHSVSEDIRSVLSVPLLCKGKLIGVLNLFNKKSEGGFTSNDQRLLSIIASQSAQVIENARLYEQEKQLRLIEQELTMARSIQERLLPKEAPDIEGFDVAGASFAAKEVGGDYFDFISLNDGRWAIALGDVSGKGIPAALLMSSVQATLRNQALSAESLVDCMVKSNLFLYNNTESTKFVTLFCGLLEPKRKLFRYVNAGHNYPFYVDTRGSVQKLDVGGLMMGIMPETQYEEASLELHTGDIIVIYSDGVTEAESELEDMY
ncbi:MAG: GAF domain-containing protein, partial [Calditrichaeota bacterium]